MKTSKREKNFKGEGKDLFLLFTINSYTKIFYILTCGFFRTRIVEKFAEVKVFICCTNCSLEYYVEKTRKDIINNFAFK